MAVGYSALPELLPIAGIRWGVGAAGIKYADRDDLVVMELCEGATCAGVFTRNAFCAAPVHVAKAHLAAGAPRYFVINTGNANAGTGAQGMRDAQATCEAFARVAACDEAAVLPFSTGVIGEPLPMERLLGALPAAHAALDENAWVRAANGILTTDTIAKGASTRIDIDGKPVTITGIAKGSGMIRPDMATMLAYVATDAAVPKALLQECLNQAVNRSFNRITVDGDTSTNDACMLVATGKSGLRVDAEGAAFDQLTQAITELCQRLAQLIIRDGEGATKFISIEVNGGQTEAECEQVAYTIAHSPLVKTALFASDPNWGRILAAVGRAGVENLDLDAVSIHLGDVCIVRDGGRDYAYEEARGQAVMDRDEITIRVDLARGAASATVWTCDFSYDYVRINAEYRS